MARRSLKPQLNQIRAWVRQGRTDAWIAHQLEVTVQQIETFKRENDLAPDAADNGGEGFAEEIDLRAEDDALIAAELEAAAEAEEAQAAEEPGEDAEEDSDEADDAEDSDKPAAAKGAGRRRGRRGGRGRRKGGPLEGTFDHGEEGYGLWLDPAVQDDPVYAEHWAGHRPVTVTVEEDSIVIRRSESE
ncbi:MAG: hypothetical protein QOI91_2017 [Solirubrobacteraceae bacterium]|jgi:hypothetical protein|nr:hypothetical protein [Solirubrobacteraceae bacterium]